MVTFVGVYAQAWKKFRSHDLGSEETAKKKKEKNKQEKEREKEQERESNITSSKTS